MPTASRSLLLLVLVPALLIGCGGDDEESPGTPPVATSPSAARPAFVRAAEAVCATAVSDARKVLAPSNAAEYVAAAETILAAGEKGLAGLRAVPLPPEDADALRETLLEPIAEQVAGFRAAVPKYRAAAASSNPAAALATIPDPGAGVTVDLEYIERYGLPTCAVFAGKRG